MGFFRDLRLYVGARRDLHRMANALERIANRMEGRPLPPEELPKEERGSTLTDVAYTSEKEYSKIYATEARLAAHLGRQPTPEEIIQAVVDEEAEPEVKRE